MGKVKLGFAQCPVGACVDQMWMLVDDGLTD
jgi:hypothetical protein